MGKAEIQRPLKQALHDLHVGETVVVRLAMLTWEVGGVEWRGVSALLILLTCSDSVTE